MLNVNFRCEHVHIQNPVCDNLDAAADSNHWWLPWRGSDGDGAHLVVKAIVVSIINNKVEDVSYWLTARLQWRDVPVGRNIDGIYLWTKCVLLSILFEEIILVINLYLFDRGLRRALL